MKPKRSFFVILGLFLMVTVAALLGTPVRGSTAYVVFGGQVVAVDTSMLVVVGRMSFLQYVRPAHCATLLPTEHVLCVAGERPKGWGILTISLPDLKAERFRVLACAPETFLDVQQVRRLSRGNAGVVLQLRTSRAVRRGEEQRFDFVDAHSLDSHGSFTLERTEEDCPDEQMIASCTTPDGRKLLLVTSGGLHEQSYLRAYALPSLRPVGKVPLLVRPDDGPVDIFIE